MAKDLFYVASCKNLDKLFEKVAPLLNTTPDQLEAVDGRVQVKGNLFGGQLDAELIGGILKLDGSGNLIADTDTSTTVASRVFFAGIQGGFTMAGIGGFEIQFALSSLGPLGVLISVSLPEGIMLDPDTGLSINNFVASIAETPFGGVKESGYGREGGTEGLQHYTVVKNVSHLMM